MTEKGIEGICVGFEICPPAIATSIINRVAGGVCEDAENGNDLRERLFYPCPCAIADLKIIYRRGRWRCVSSASYEIVHGFGEGLQVIDFGREIAVKARGYKRSIGGNPFDGRGQRAAFHAIKESE